LTVCGNNITFGSSFTLQESTICGNVYITENPIEKPPTIPNLFLSGSIFVNKNLFVTGSSSFSNLVTMNRNLIVNGRITLANCGDVAQRIIRADSLPSSDINLKENIKPIENAIDKVKKLNGVEFDFKNSNDYGYLKRHQIGLIAQEVEKVIPEVVSENNNGYLGVSYQHLTGLLIEAIKDQQNQIEELKSEINLLKEKINE
jgi:hypothetical protein